ncbi:MAG TPA: hypothetical protein VLA12_03105, partial [Planctomycetaceae bacterium]|nr:hypothetical protein [Planctomycetaceae bacterium]
SCLFRLPVAVYRTHPIPAPVNRPLIVPIRIRSRPAQRTNTVRQLRKRRGQLSPQVQLNRPSNRKLLER